MPDEDPYGDKYGQGYFCNNLWYDESGFFCAQQVAAGHSDFCVCPFEEEDCFVGSGSNIICESKRIGRTCEDFQPGKTLREKLLGKPDLPSKGNKKHKFLDI